MNIRFILMLIYLLQPVAFGSWLPRIPDVQSDLDLGAAELALALMGLPVGIVLVLPVATRLMEKVGGRVTMAFGFTAMLISMPLVVSSVSQTMLFLTLCAVGATNTILLLALNVNATNVERSQQIAILNTCHGFGSVGLMLGSLLGSVFAALSVSPGCAVGLIAIGLLPCALWLVYLLPVQEPGNTDSNFATETVGTMPTWPLLSICLFAFGIAMTEGAIADWSAVYLRERFSAGGGVAGVGFTVFAAAVALGRFMGDAIKIRYGPVATARVFGVLAIVGCSVVTGASTVSWVFFGFAVLGFGVSVGYPLAVSSVSLISGPGQRSEKNVATLTFIALLGFLTGPPLIGFVAEYFGIRLGLMMLLPMLTISLLLTKSLRVAKELNS